MKLTKKDRRVIKEILKSHSLTTAEVETFKSILKKDKDDRKAKYNEIELFIDGKKLAECTTFTINHDDMPKCRLRYGKSPLEPLINLIKENDKLKEEVSFLRDNLNNIKYHNWDKLERITINLGKKIN